MCKPWCANDFEVLIRYREENTKHRMEEAMLLCSSRTSPSGGRLSWNGVEAGVFPSGPVQERNVNLEVGLSRPDPGSATRSRDIPLQPQKILHSRAWRSVASATSSVEMRATSPNGETSPALPPRHHRAKPIPTPGLNTMTRQPVYLYSSAGEKPHTWVWSSPSLAG